MKLLSFGEVDEEVVSEQMTEIRRERDLLRDRLRSLRPAPAMLPHGIDEQLLARACRAVERWLDEQTKRSSSSPWRSRSPSSRRGRGPQSAASSS